MCMICGNDKETRYIDLYIIGSEGLRVCHSCQMQLVEFVRNLRSEKLKKKFDNVKNKKLGE